MKKDCMACLDLDDADITHESTNSSISFLFSFSRIFKVFSTLIEQ